jgi:predicted dehydrogenase
MGRSLASVGAVGAAAAAARAAATPWTALAGAKSSILGANERVRFAVIGCGGQGRVDMKTFFKASPNVECPLICDVDDEQFKHTIYALEQLGQAKPETVKDWRKVIERKDIDVIVLATPDHWHPLPLIEAVQAGKDLYCEKPLANSIGEGKVMLDFARKHERVVQIGTQWRASKHIGEAIDYVHTGQLGKIRLVRCWAALDWFPSIGKVPDSETPPGVDYDMWLGPAPKRPFNKARFHFTFRWFWDYAGGLMTDWGVHLLNIALWGMKVNVPKRVASTGGKYVYDDSAETPDTQCTLYDYGDFTLVWEHQAGTGHGAEGRGHGVAFYGSEGTLVVDAGGWQVYPETTKKGQTKPPIAAVQKKLEEDGEQCRVNLVKNFLDCTRSRQRPIMDIERGYHVTAVAHLGNLALRTGRSIEYDAGNLKVIGNDAANGMITNPYRAPWMLPRI